MADLVSKPEYKYHYAYQDGNWIFKFAEAYSNLSKEWSTPENFKEDDFFNIK